VHASISTIIISICSSRSMDKSLSSSPPPSPHTDSSASPPRIENPEAEQPAYGRVAELERILLQQQREVERLQLAAKEKLAEAAQQLGAAKQALEEAKMGADWEIDFISKKRVRGGVTEYRVVWTP